MLLALQQYQYILSFYLENARINSNNTSNTFILSIHG